MTKMNTKKSFSGILNFSFLRGEKGKKNIKFKKIQVVKHNSGTNTPLQKNFK